MIIFAGCVKLEIPVNPLLTDLPAESFGISQPIVTQTRDDYRKTVTFKGIDLVKSLSLGQYGIPNEVLTVFPRASISLENNQMLFVQLYCRYTADDWMFIDYAIDINGTAIELIAIDTNVHSGGIISEDVGLSLTREKFEQASEEGFNIKLYGKKGSVDFFYPPAQVRSFLDSLDRYINLKKSDPSKDVESYGY